MFRNHQKECRGIGRSEENRTLTVVSFARLLPAMATILAVLILCSGLFRPVSAKAAEASEVILAEAAGEPVEVIDEDGYGYMVDEPGMDRQNKTVTVTVKDGAVSGPESHSLGTSGASHEGTYHFSLSWLPEGVEERNFSKYLSEVSDPKAKKPENYPGFLTVFVLMDEKGSVVYSTNAVCFTIDADITLEPGDYTLMAFYAANASEYEEIAREYLCADRSAERWARESNVDSVTRDGTYRMKYAYTLQYFDSSKYQAGLYIGVGLGLLFSGLILLMIWIFASKNRRLEKGKYDERQLLARGKAASAAFFTTLVLMLVVGLGDAVGLFRSLLHENLGFFFMAALFGGVIVYAFFCIMEDAYIALNERTGVVIATVSVIGVINAIIFCTDLFTGQWLIGGRLSMKSINGLCALVSLFIILFMILKKVRSSQKDREEDEDEDEDGEESDV